MFYANPKTFLSTTLGMPPKTSKMKAATGSWFRGWFGAPRGFGREDMIEVQGIGWDGKPGKKVWPEYVVFFQQMEPIMKDVLRGSAYRECWRGWNSWGHDDWRRQGEIIVWCQRRQEKARRKGILAER